MLISVAIPCYRSEKNLCTVVSEIKEEFAKRSEHDYQLILVCDGSPDHTDAVIRKLCAEDPKITGVLLSRNFTQANAKMAALPYLKGEVLVYMDDDGQHPAEGIFRLVEKLNEGYDAVYADFEVKQQSAFKTLVSNMNLAAAEFLGIKPKGIKTSSFIAYSGFAVEELKKYQSPAPSAVGYLYSVTTKFANVEFPQRARLSGKSGYTLKKLIDLAITSYTNFTIIPLRIADYVGIISAIIGFLYGLYLVIRKLFFASVVPGYTSTIAIMLILGGLILVSLGLLGEYVGRIYMLLSNKPQYVIREVINGES